MNLQAVITPAGELIIESGVLDDGMAVPISQASAEALIDSFARSAAAGLVQLAAGAPQSDLPADLLFWREFAEQFFHLLRGMSEAEVQQAISSPRLRAALLTAPEQRQWAERIDSAPPMRGLEYLTPEVLRRLWLDLQQFALDQAATSKPGPLAWLQTVDPLWQLLGRVTFHIAENKGDPERPFAFLATYAHQISGQSKLRHLPLAQALQQYAGEKNQRKLTDLLKPVQRAAETSPLVRAMLESRELFRPQALTIAQAHTLLRSAPELEAAGLVMRLPDWWRARRVNRPQVQVTIGQQAASQVGLDGLLDFSIDLALAGEPLTDAEQRALLETTAGLTLLRGRWVEVDPIKFQQALEHWHAVAAQHSDGIDFIQGMRLLAGVSIGKEDAAALEPGWTRVTAGDWLNSILARIRDPAGGIDCEPGRDLQATLRPYQVDGVRWLWFMTSLGLGACLADDMGLGKTIQVIDLLLLLKAAAPTKNKRGRKQTAPSLLVVPASLIGNWKSEFERFAPAINVMYLHRSETEPERLEQIAAAPARRLSGFDVVITTYGLARRLAWLSTPVWRLVVLDEAQAIKNATSAQARAVTKLKSGGRIALSGTPIENHLGELWSLFNFCCPGLLGSAAQYKAFIKRLSKQQDAQAYGALRKLVRPYILRRMKTDPDVVPDLPDKTEMRVDCGLSKRQAGLYQSALRSLSKQIETVDGMQRRGLVLSTLMQLKQICNHPDQYLHQDEYAPQHSGKMQRLQQICQAIIERQERVLVFTQFQTLTQPLATFLATVFGRDGLVLHGGVAVKKRKQLVAQFQADNGPPYFVISVKAGGTGLNLTAASHVVHFDRWWNPAVENQATDRAFRIGQKRNVVVHKFVCQGTVEERIDEMIRSKLALSDQLLNDGPDRELTEMTDAELLEFVAIDLNRAALDD